MEREILFRAWDEGQKYMAYQGAPDLETIQSFMHHFGDKKLMEFVGLKDKKGKKIYDGDIVEFDNTVMECKWWQDKCRFVFYEKVWKETHEVNIENCKKCKVIGNVFENPPIKK